MSDVIQKIASEITNVGAMLMEQRIHDALTAAGVDASDLLTGKAYADRIMSDHADCRGTGIKPTWSKGNTLITVELCPCLEVRVAVRIHDGSMG